MGRGGDSVHVAVVPKDKKDRFVLHSQVSGVIGGDETGNFEALPSSDKTAWLDPTPLTLLKNVI